MPQKSKSSKVSSKKGNYVKNPAPDDDPQKLANDSPISEEQTETKTIFERGVSNKGRERGIGLANVTEILDNYINVNLETQSNNFSFTQQLTITKKA